MTGVVKKLARSTYRGAGIKRPRQEPIFKEDRDLLISIAYRVLGSMTDAEDTVQETWLRWSKVDPAEVSNPRAFLVRLTTRLAIDRLRRESYVGPWLPEPILTGRDVAEDVALAESVSMAMLVVLETLSPLERAVFVLREAFGMPYATWPSSACRSRIVRWCRTWTGRGS